MNEDLPKPNDEELEEITAFDVAMADPAPSISWTDVKKRLGLEP